MIHSIFNIHDAIALEGGAKSYYYNAEPPADVASKYWKDSYNTYHFIPETSANYYKSSSNNLVLYIVIGVVAVVAVAAIAFFVFKKK